MANGVARTREFTMEVVEELKKVTWPDYQQLKNSTLVIVPSESLALAARLTLAGAV